MAGEEREIAKNEEGEEGLKRKGKVKGKGKRQGVTGEGYLYS